MNFRRFPNYDWRRKSEQVRPGQPLGANIGSRTDITLRAQKDVNGNETLLRMGPHGNGVVVGQFQKLTHYQRSRPILFVGGPGPDDFRGPTGSYFTIGGSTNSGVYVLQGDMAYFRLFSTSAPASVGEPSDTSSTGDLLDYEFENNLNDSSGKGQALTSFPLGGSFTYQ